MSPTLRFKQIALAAVLLCQTASVVAEDASCGSVCKHIRNPDTAGSIGGSIEDSVGSGNTGIVAGRRREDCAGYYDASGVWHLYVKALESHSSLDHVAHIQATGDLEDKVCVDRVDLAKLTAAASRCHSSGSGAGSASGSMKFPSDEQDPLGGATGGIGGSVHGNLGGAGLDSGAASGGAASGGSSGGAGFGSGSVSGGGAAGGAAGGSGSVSHSSSGWGHGNVNDQSICFKIKDKRSDRYLTSGGSEYAFARLPNYYSTFRAYPSKSVEGGYSVTEVNRSGSKVSYPVKVSDYYSSFKPLYGDKDAVWTFSPAQFGDSCWGTPGKKMSRRHDWGGWGDNYRFASSGEDCADVELEEASC